MAASCSRSRRSLFTFATLFQMWYHSCGGLNDSDDLGGAAVPVGYVMAVAFVAVGTLFALVPVRRPRPLAGVAFRLGLVVSELPFAALCWLLVWTLFAAGQGDIGSPGGWAVAGLAILAAAGLTV